MARRTLAPRDQAAAHRQGPRDEFDGENPPPTQFALSGEDHLDLLDAAAGGLGGDATHDPECSNQDERTRDDQSEPARNRRRVQARRQDLGTLVGLVEDGVEGVPGKSGQRPDQGCSEIERPEDLDPVGHRAAHVANDRPDHARVRQQ